MLFETVYLPIRIKQEVECLTYCVHVLYVCKSIFAVSKNDF